ncbi:3-oxoacyl-ACP synthase [Paramaledivibacter caminithermalis]|jgi:3-oxoacyl-[acyl-carrier-protein] synthase-3|uniref:3-oxoacyl-[acyl-carrier-protein] synthase-3 n=1 Tax=Paramaledivibacter caminithermalis (strain DSM 15212 / CIP 107654 / DViRD3) TaxID=1121301 RepID=A0A1M6MD37_PARC5|nr:3-oxoacyl-ACP synthase [Paramaledivibacter caminithermalis]SHJ81340.1 3-oxoacyl-[acyl-carrier-protein] synthase-3 [Paramaledivibacter caminithermalis DSM 15212]
MEKNSIVGIKNIGVYVPESIRDANYIAEKSGIPKDIIENKFGIKRVHKAGLNEHVSDMAIKAAKEALVDFDPMDLDLVVYCGSEYKDYYLFNLAAKVQYSIGAKNANAFEIHSLCSAGVLSLNVLKSMILNNPDIENVLLVSASKETDLIDYTNQRARFMFNFGDGAAAALLSKGYMKNIILATHMISDGSFADDLAVFGVGSKNYYNYDMLGYDLRNLDVKDAKSMKERLDPISLDNFCKVISRSVEKSGYRPDKIDFIAPIFMKRSILGNILGRFNLTEENSFVLENYGHCQSADAYISLKEANKLGRLKDGDVVVMLGAGTGYTWAATTILWGESNENYYQ